MPDKQKDAIKLIKEGKNLFITGSGGVEGELTPLPLNII